MSDTISFSLNGKPETLAVRPDTTVLDLLRSKLRLTGTKEGCAEGDCGACTVLLRRQGINGGEALAANACIMTAAQIDGAEITTVEGLANDGVLSALQEALAENGSSQCGFCTPGITVALSGLLARNEAPTEDEIHEALAGNLCRCTGYRPIVEAAQKAAGTLEVMAEAGPVSDAPALTEYDGAKAHRPANLDALLELRAQLPDAHILAGGTDLGVARAGYETDWPDTILTAGVEELRAIAETDENWTFGAAVTWHEMLQKIGDHLPSLAIMLQRFGSAQIRSMGTIGGNIGTASPIGDGPPALIALGATITMASKSSGIQTIPLEDFFLDYRKTALPEDGVIVSVTVPKLKRDEHFRVYKISKRYDQDISTVCGAYWIKLDGETISEARIAYGGMAAIPKRAPAAEQALVGKPLTPEIATSAGGQIARDFTPLSDWRGSADYRATVAAGLFKRLAHDLAGETVEVMAL